MLIEIPHYTERFGSVRIHDVQRVLELDSGREKKSKQDKIPATIYKAERDKIESIQEKLAIVIPVKKERLKLLEGVLTGIPHDCLVIVVSNSPREPADRFMMEKDALIQFNIFTQRPIFLIHQKDPGLALAFRESGYTEILDKQELVRDGKAEAMVTGLMLAKSAGKEYVGFIDADNYVPGAVNEYVKNYAVGFCMANSPYVMVRNSWKFKPKISERGLFFRKRGRISEFTNKYLNMLLSVHTGFETDVIKTGNAGEHAMSMKLAEILEYSSGFSIETYEIVYILEEFSGARASAYRDAMEKGVEIFQIETRNPHFHEEKGDEHLQNMLLASLSVIYYSFLAEDTVKSAILDELVSQKILEPNKKPNKLPILPSIQKIKCETFRRILEENAETFTIIE
ncbi:MAG: mannosyl-3-phosphoglycerate synthase [Candidatus Odinarchaeia archaeon]